MHKKSTRRILFTVGVGLLTLGVAASSASASWRAPEGSYQCKLDGSVTSVANSQGRTIDLSQVNGECANNDLIHLDTEPETLQASLEGSLSGSAGCNGLDVAGAKSTFGMLLGTPSLILSDGESAARFHTESGWSFNSGGGGLNGSSSAMVSYGRFNEMYGSQGQFGRGDAGVFGGTYGSYIVETSPNGQFCGGTTEMSLVITFYLYS